MLVEELAAVIRVKLEHREGQAGEDTAEGISDDKLALAEDGGDLAPARGVALSAPCVRQQRIAPASLPDTRERPCDSAWSSPT